MVGNRNMYIGTLASDGAPGCPTRRRLPLPVRLLPTRPPTQYPPSPAHQTTRLMTGHWLLVLSACTPPIRPPTAWLSAGLGEYPANTEMRMEIMAAIHWDSLVLCFCTSNEF